MIWRGESVRTVFVGVRAPQRDHVTRRQEGRNLGSVQVGGMLHYARVVTIVSVLDDGVEELSEHLTGNIKRSVFPP